MNDEKTVTLAGKVYTWTKSGWVEAKSRLTVDLGTARKLDRLSFQEFGQASAQVNDPHILLKQAADARMHNQFIRAEQLIRRVINLQSSHSGAYAMLCSILRDRGLPQKALDETEAVRRSSYPPLLTSRAAAYCDLDQWEDAAKEIAVVLAMGGSNEAWKVVERIKKEKPDIYRHTSALASEKHIHPPESAAQVREVSQKTELKSVIIYTDGACLGNPGPGGYGIVLISGIHRKEISGGYQYTTNNRMEILAAIVALRHLKYKCQVTVYSDSQYLVDGISKGWARSWKRKGWMRNSKERAANSDLWSELLDLCDQHEVTFQWVRGHAGNEENECCDRLSVKAAQQSNLLIDTGFATDNSPDSSVGLFD